MLKLNIAYRVYFHLYLIINIKWYNFTRRKKGKRSCLGVLSLWPPHPQYLYTIFSHLPSIGFNGLGC